MVNQAGQHKQEVETKLTRLRERMAARQLDAVLISLVANTAWITAGAATYVNEATDGSASSILVTHDRAYILTDGIEGPRLTQEEGLVDLGFEMMIKPWYARGGTTQLLIEGKRLARDDRDFAGDLRDLRSVLLPGEVERMRHVSTLAAEVMDDAIRAVKPGNSEYELASRLAAGSRLRGGNAIVNLVASDDRIYKFRHPLPTAKTVEKYAMLVLCLRMSGLVASITRLIHFGPLPDDLKKRAMAVARIDARLITGTKPPRTMHDMFNLARQAYTDEGYPEAIEQHHQGGSAGYQPREIIAVPADYTPVKVNQVFAWNPSVQGVKSEDTIIVGEQANEVLTVVHGWPTWDIDVDGQTIKRPAILEA